MLEITGMTTITWASAAGSPSPVSASVTRSVPVSPFAQPGWPVEAEDVVRRRSVGFTGWRAGQHTRLDRELGRIL